MKNLLFFGVLLIAFCSTNDALAQLKPLKTVKLDKAAATKLKLANVKVNCNKFQTKAEYVPYFNHLSERSYHFLFASLTIISSSPGERNIFVSHDLNLPNGADILITQSEVSCDGFKKMIKLKDESGALQNAEVAFTSKFGHLSVKRDDGTYTSLSLTPLGNGVYQGISTAGTTTTTVIFTLQKVVLDVEAGLVVVD